MESILDYMSGGIPGGIYILFFVLLAIQLIFINFNKSGLVSKKDSRKRRFIFSLSVILIYFILWYTFRPPAPRIRVIVLPSIENNKFKLTPNSIRFPELIDRSAFNNQGDRYLIHRWPWLYKVVGQDSVNNYQTWFSIAKRMSPGIIIESTVKEDGSLDITIHNYNSQKEEPLRISGTSFILLNKINEKLDLFDNSIKKIDEIPHTYLQAKLALLSGEYDEVDTLLEKYTDVPSVELRAAALVRKGRMKKIDREKAKYTKIENPDLNKAKKLLFTLINKREDSPETAFLLGRIAQYEEKFEDANTFLKKALAEDLYNSRIYYALSFLLSSRLKELEFDRRDQILEKALYFDPGFRNAVMELSQHYYNSSSGSPSSAGIIKAIATINRYLQIKPDDPFVLSSFASIKMKIQKLDEALVIFKELKKRFPRDSNTYYNVGSVYFYKKEYRKALNNFLQAIEIDQNIDAFLMAGLTYRQIGNNDSALYYYRERIKRKTGDDDFYAVEAMKGIRSILQESETKNEN